MRVARFAENVAVGREWPDLRSVIISQKACSWRRRCLGGLPAMIAELIAPMETPDT
jgi:hypothetical protein